MTRRLALWTLRRALGPSRAETVMGDLDEEIGRSATAASRMDGLRLLLRALTFAIAVRWADRRPRPAFSGSLSQDVRYAWRSVRRRPGRFVAAAGMLGLAIGLTTAMFTVVDALLIRPVPFPAPDRLVQLYLGNEHGGPSVVPLETYRAWRDRGAFDGVSATWSATQVLNADGNETAEEVALVTPGTFEMVGGVRPLLGRLFSAADGEPGADDRVILSEALWRSAFSADPSVAGRRVSLDGTPVVVVGVLPDGFRFPDWTTRLWRATTFAEADSGSQGRVLVYARLGADIPRADALRLATDDAHATGTRASLSAQTRALAGSNLDATDARAIRLLSGGVVLLFVLLCANASSLLLAGLTSREHELGTRAALGASRGRLARQAFLEHVVVGLAGVGAGLAIAWTLIAAARTLVPEAVLLQSLNALDLDARALWSTSLAGLAATVGAGLLPALAGTRIAPGRLLNTAGRTGTESPRARRLARTLLVSQVAICCTLLLGATVLVRSFVHLSEADRGIDVRQVLVAWVSLTDPVFASPDARRAATREIADLALALPGVSRVAWSYGHPPLGAMGYDGDWIPDGPGAEPRHVTASRSNVDGDYFALYGIPMVRGRAFQPSDGQDAAVLSERLATAIFGSTDAVGRYVTFDGQPFREVIRIVGVARDTHLPSLSASQDEPQFYRPFEPIFTPMLSVKCDGTCPDEGRLRRQLSAVARADVQSVRLPERYYLRELARPRAAAALAFGFAVTALVAAGAGLFSLLSYAVTRRRREFGIRAALGASGASLRGLVWRDGLTIIVMGVGLGLAGGASLARVMRSLLYGVALSDPINWAIVVGTIVVAVAAASWRPARTAVRTDPLLLLRED